MSEHSPTPWKGLAHCHDTFSIVDKDGKPVIRVAHLISQGSDGSKTPLSPVAAMTHADASYVLNSVNLHDELVGALDAICNEYFDAIDGSPTATIVRARRVLMTAEGRFPIDRLLAKAKGEA